MQNLEGTNKSITVLFILANIITNTNAVAVRFQKVCEENALAIYFSRQGNYQSSFLCQSDWKPPVQQSVALESYLKKVKAQLAETKCKLRKPKPNLSHGEGEAVLTF